MSPLLKFFTFGSLLLSAKAFPPSNNQQCPITTPNSLLHNPDDFGICWSELASRDVVQLEVDVIQPEGIDDPIAQQLYEGLHESTLDLSNCPLSDIRKLQDSNWINLVEISESHSRQITEVILPADLDTLSKKLKNGLKQLSSLQTLVLPKFNGKKLDIRGLLEEENAILVLNQAPALREIHVTETTQIRHQSLPPHKIRVHRTVANSGKTTISTLTGHVYFRDHRKEFAEEERVVWNANFNARAYFKNDAGTYIKKNQIVCRHLATQWLVDRANHHQRQKKLLASGKQTTPFSYMDYVEKERISQNVSPKTDQFSKQISHYGVENSLVEFSEFGKFLQAKFERMKPGQNRYFAVMSSNHQMGLELRIKQKGGEDQQYVVNFYDPNHTITHKRLVLNEHDLINNLEQFTLQLWFMDDTVRDYFGDGHSNPTLFLSALNEENLRTFSFKQSTLDRTVEYWPPNRSITDECYFLLKHNLHQQLEKLLSKLPDDHLKQYVLLEAKYHDGIPPGLYAALQEGHYQAIEFFVKAVLGSPALSEQEKFELLLAKEPGGAPGLSIALQEGHYQAIKIFVKAVLDSTLESDKKFDLLEAKSPNGTPGLSVALQNGHYQAIEFFVKAVLGSPALSEQEKFELLLAKEPNGAPGLYVALQSGYSQAIEIFVKAVLDLTLKSDKKSDFLAAKRPDGVPGLYIALQEGRSQAIEIFVKAVLDSTLESDKKFDLLAAKRPDGTPGLCMALLNGHSKAIEFFVKAVLCSTALSAQKKFYLFAGKTEKGTYCLDFLPGIPKESLDIFLQAINEATKEELSDGFKQKLKSTITKRIAALGVVD